MTQPESGTIVSIEFATGNEALIRSYFEQVWNAKILSAVESVTPEIFTLHYQGKIITATYEEHQEVVQYWLPAYQITQINVFIST